MKTDKKNQELLAVKNLVVEFNLSRRTKIHAVSGVTLQINRGETLGLVGESGCGKSTIARTIVRLQQPTSGSVWFDGEDLTNCDGKRLRELRPNIQMIFQDATASLNPGRKAVNTIAEPLRVLGRHDRTDRHRLVSEMMNNVGLNPSQTCDRYPSEFSGGQCQRISIARALITRPKLLICDEPVSSLDVSVQAQILNLLEKMKAQFQLTMLFISHDLAVVKNICDRVAVMYLGKLCEVAASEDLYRAPCHPYTAAILAAIPDPDPARPHNKLNLLSSEMPSPTAPPTGCRFRTRCPEAQHRCADVEPGLEEIQSGRFVACHYPLSH
jgi:peptide/nickel transport system ATP-binding protein